MEQMLSDTSRLLSSLTHYAAVVVGPQHEVATIKSVQLVSLSPRLVLAVLVLSSGSIEKHSFELAQDTDELVVNAAAVRLSSLIVGQTLASASTLDADALTLGESHEVVTNSSHGAFGTSGRTSPR